MTKSQTGLRFIDLFAGLGGFHVALTSLGQNCVFACEVDQELASVYETNFGIHPWGDIRTLDLQSIPAHDVLCAGFPCQPFSKAGEQQGLDCPLWGDLIDYVIRILELHQPRFFLLENVPNLLRHNGGNTFTAIKQRLEAAGYSVDSKLLSPHQFAVPQIRQRAFIVGVRGATRAIEWPIPQSSPGLNVTSVLDAYPAEATSLSDIKIRALEAWQEFLSLYPGNEELPSFPIWATEFGASYPYEATVPLELSRTELARSRGSFGVSLADMEGDRLADALPPYARSSSSPFPKWKVDFIRQNRDLYARHRSWIDAWKTSLLGLAPSHQKFEWNCKGEERDLWKHVIQFRASGIRVKRATWAPSLVAMTSSQVPVIGWERRHMTVRECSRLQCLGELPTLPRTSAAAFRALGNAVNARVVALVAKALLETPFIGTGAPTSMGLQTGTTPNPVSPRSAYLRQLRATDAP